MFSKMPYLNPLQQGVRIRKKSEAVLWIADNDVYMPLSK
jgi:hypothetical protein